jgi:hypothetical protein
MSAAGISDLQFTIHNDIGAVTWIVVCNSDLIDFRGKESYIFVRTSPSPVYKWNGASWASRGT